MTDKVKSEDFIKAFGEGVKQMENVKPVVIDCKYYLPCGRCDKTNGLCSQLDEIIVCWTCKYFGEKAATGHCIKCRDKDMWETKAE